MKRLSFIPLLLLLVWGTASLGFAKEEISLLIAGNRDAVIKISDKANGDDFQGDIKGSFDLKGGSSALVADLTVNEPAMQGSKAHAYAKLAPANIEMIGDMDIKLPESGDAPEKLTFTLQSVTKGDNSMAKADLDVAGPLNDEDVPTLSADGTMEGTFKQFKADVGFNVAHSQMQGQIPFDTFELAISDAADITNLNLTLKVPTDSPMVNQLGALPGMKPMIEQGLTAQAGLTVDKVEIPAIADENGMKVAKVNIALKDVRGTIGKAVDANAAAMGAPGIDGQTMAAAVKQMIQVKANNFSITLNAKDASLDGKMAMDLAEVDKFFEGYLTIAPAIAEMQKQNQDFSDMGEFAPFMAAFIDISSTQSQEMLKMMIGSPMEFKGSGNFNMTPKTEGEGEQAKQTLAITGKLDFNSTGYAEFVKKAKAAGVPVAETALIDMAMNLKGENNLVGQMYVYSDGDILEYYKKLLVAVLKEGGAPEDIQKMASSFELKDAAMAMSLDGQKMNINATSSTSELSGSATSLLKQFLPTLEGELTGVSIDAKFGEDGKGNADVGLYYANLFPGKSGDEVRKALNLPSGTTVNDKAAEGDVKLVAVEAPEVAPAGELVAIRDEAQKALGAAAVAATGGGPAGGGGSKSWMLILGGLLVLGLIGVGLAAGRKSA